MTAQLEKEIEFSSPGHDRKLSGRRINVPGYEDIDFAIVESGFAKFIYEVCTGMEVVHMNAFSDEEAISQLVNGGMGRLTAERIYGKAYSNEQIKRFISNPLVLPLNPELSPAYLKFAAEKDRKEAELPYLYTPEERAAFINLAAEARSSGAVKTASIIAAQSDRKMYKTWLAKETVEHFRKSIQNELDESARALIKKGNVPYPEIYKNCQITNESLEDFRKKCNQFYKTDHTEKIDPVFFERMYQCYRQYLAIHNHYGYCPKELTFELYGPALGVGRLMVCMGAKSNREERVQEQIETLEKEIVFINDLFTKLNLK